MIAFRLGRPFRTIASVSPTTVALAAVLVVALGLRVYGLDWDRGQYLHPDERHIVSDILVARISLDWPPDLDALFDPATSPINPRSVNPETGRPREFAYGALPLYITDLAAEVLGWFTAANWHEYAHAYKVGRFLSAVMDTLTVLIVFAIGARVMNRRVGLIAATIAALTPLSIQLAHYFTTDSWLTTFVTLCLYCSIRAAERGAVRWFLAAGLAFGLAMASKGSVFSLGGIVALAIVYDAWRRWRDGETPLGALTEAPQRIAVSGIAAVAAFAVFEPYALMQPSVYRQSFATQADIVRGVFDVPFTRQYIGTTPVVYQLDQLLRFGMGPVAGLLAIAGVLLLGWRLLKRRRAAELIILAWLLGYGLVIALPEAKFMRYMAPLVPLLAVAGGLAVETGWRFLAARFNTKLATGAAAAALIGVAVWAASFQSIYAAENTRLRASTWIYAHVPAGSTLSNEYWDDSLPKALGPGLTAEDRQFGSVTFDLYGDKVAWSEVTAYADRLALHSLTAPAANALRAGDFRAAALILRDLGPVAAVLPQPDRDGLAATLDAAATELSGPADTLAHATREAAGALRGDPELMPTAFIPVADAVVLAGENEAANYIYTRLEQIDYYVISSNRVLSSLPHSPWRYPVPIHFYDLLERGALGFELVAEFRQPPRFGPVTFNDDRADESWLNYDHPHVWIYKKVKLVSPETYATLMAGARAQEVSPTRYPREDLTLDQPVGELPVVADARWSAALTANSWAALGIWLALLMVLHLVGWPWVRLLFGRFADGGWSFARLIAVLFGGYVVWIGASTEVLSFRALWCWAALALLGAGGWAWLLRRRDRLPRRNLAPEQRRVAVVGEAVFWAVFAFFLLLRYLNPDSWHPIWGGEKPMEFAHLNATLRSAHFPPFDPWYADGYVNYYYYGLYLIAFCLKLTGIPSEIGFNLAQPTVLALFAASSYGLAATFGRDLAAPLRRRTVAPVGIAAGLVGAVLLVGIGNLDAFRLWLANPEIRGSFSIVWDPSRAIFGAITEFPFFTGLYADLHAHVVALPITIFAIATGYSLTKDRRRIALAAAAPHRDLGNAALVITKVGLLALTCGALFATNAWDFLTYFALGAASLFLATGAIRPPLMRFLVWIAASSALAVAAYALFLPYHQHYIALLNGREVVLRQSVAQTTRPTSFWEFAAHLGGLLTIVAFGLVTLLVARRDGQRIRLGQPVVPVALVALLLFARALLPPDANEVREALTIASVLAPALTLFAAAWIAAKRESPAGGHTDRATVAIRSVLGLTFALSLAAIAADGVVLGSMIAVAAAAGLLWLVGDRLVSRYLALMVGGAALLVGALELVFLADDLRGSDHERMNSIFKFYNQVWTLLALAGAAFVARMTTEAWPSIIGGKGWWLAGSASTGFADRPLPMPAAMNHAPFDSDVESGPTVYQDQLALDEPASARWARAGLIVTAVVIALSLVYPVLAIRPRLEQRFTSELGSETLNGLDWMEYGTIPLLDRNAAGRLTSVGELRFADDRAAIGWFWDNVAGSPVIAEASIGPYRCNGSRFSIATGLPTIIGWERHLRQQRYWDGLDERVRDVRALYANPDPAAKLRILREYDVEYVVVGPLERRGVEIYENTHCRPTDVEAGIAAFHGMVGTSLEIAFRQGETTIYRVLPESATRSAPGPPESR